MSKPALSPMPHKASVTPISEAERRLTLKEILRLLLEDQLISREEAEQVHAERHTSKAGAHPLTVIAERQFKNQQPPHRPLHLEALTEWLAGRLGLEYFHIDPLKINFASVTEVMSAAYAGRLQVLPVQVTPHEVVIASAEPYIREWERELTPALRRPIRRVFANPVDIERFQIEFYNLARSVKKAAQKEAQQGSAISNFEQLVELSKTNRQFDANEQHIVSIVDWLWQYAFEQRASDIHVEPRRDAGIVRFRIDGVLHQVYQLPMSVITAMTSRIKILGRMDVVEKRRPQDGRVKTRTPQGTEIELRLSTLPTAFGEKLVMRIFDPDVLVRNFGELGFTDDDLNRWNHMTRQPNGIILVTGPTGSGKTTTLYSTLKQLATSEVNVCTIEDPIEMVEGAFNQMQVQAGIELGFADGVRALMRQDPDIIMIGEIRDLQTAEMAIQAALTGHLVLSTLHTNDAPSAITRMLDLGVPSYLLNATVLGVMAQRLVRTLCPHCKEAAAPTEEEAAAWAQLAIPFKAPVPGQIHHPVGCLECRNTGYSGRMGIYETLLMSPAISRLIQQGADLALIRQQAYREDMKPLRISGALKIAKGLTSLDEVLRIAPPAQDEKMG
ncbi:GspE/PulE family protein [Uliginosibacterium sp. 31-16]|uniref:GspE/PulE family protein n=1 Tax=Uliginosibacterium sp. 31-16 TaxID=3068315 RepID=UPI00273F2839|nr:GspE/PulE family protein [Uliginosibacterium sp. 31-16]MDP5240095.1 GspE/PulE family protein [Uliginosibacterium sp. 31-16]